MAFKATVIEHRDVWYMDDGPLTKEFCEEEQNFDDALSVPLICCACTEAKYEVKNEIIISNEFISRENVRVLCIAYI